MVHRIVLPAYDPQTDPRVRCAFCHRIFVHVGPSRGRRRCRKPPPLLPGAQADGTLLLPNGWKLSPTGRHLFTGPMPLNVVTTRRTASTRSSRATASPSRRSRSSISPSGPSRTPSPSTARGSAWPGIPTAAKLYSAGAGQNNVQEFTYADGIADQGAHVQPARGHGRDVRRRTRHQSRRPDALRDARLRDDALGDRRRHRSGDEDGEAAGRAVRLRGFARRPHGLRVAVGRAPGPVVHAATR